MTAYYAQSGSAGMSTITWDAVPTGGSPLSWTGNHPNDDFYANGYTGIVVDGNYTLGSIRTEAGGGSAGGSFTTSTASADRTLTSDIVAGTTPCLALTGSSTYTCTIHGNITGGSESAAYGLSVTGNAVKLTIGSTPGEFTVSGGSNATAYGIFNNSGIGTGVFNCDFSASSLAYAASIYTYSAASVHSIYGALTSTGTAYAYVNGSTAGTVKLYGDVVQASGATAFPFSIRCGFAWEAAAGTTIALRTAADVLVTLYVPDYPAEADVESPVEYDYGALTGSLEASSGYTYGSEDASEVLTTATGAGTYIPVAVANVRAGTAVGVDPAVGTCEIPAASDVRFGEDVDDTTGTCYVPAAADVRFGTNVDATTGTAYIPAAADVEFGVDVDDTTGTFVVPAQADVWYGTGQYGAGGTEFTPAMRASDITVTGGTAATLTAPDIGVDIVVDDLTGTLDIPSTASIATAVVTAIKDDMAIDAGPYMVNLYEVKDVDASTALGDTDDFTGAMATAMQADPTDFPVNVMEVNGTTQTTGTDIPAVISSGTYGLSALKTLIDGVPTTAEFEARTLPSADYVVVTDTIAGVTTATNLTNLPTMPADWVTASGMKADAVTEILTAMKADMATDPTPYAVNVVEIGSQTVTCNAGVTVYAKVGTATASTAQSGDVFAQLPENFADMAITMTTGKVGVEDSTPIEVDVVSIHGSGITETSDGYLAGCFTSFFDQSATAFTSATPLSSFKATGFSTHSASDVKTAIEAAGGHLALILEDTGTTIPGTLTTIGNYVDCLPASWVVPATAAELAAVQTHGDSTWATATSLSEAGNNAVADATLVRDVSNVEDAATLHSLGGIVLAATEFSRDGTTITVYKTDGETEFDTLEVTEDATSVSITGATGVDE